MTLLSSSTKDCRQKRPQPSAKARCAYSKSGKGRRASALQHYQMQWCAQWAW